MGDVTSLAEHTENAGYQSPEQILEEALADERENPSDAMLILPVGVKDEGGNPVFRVSYYNSKLSCSQMLALGEILKTMALAEMGYIESPAAN